MGRKRPTNDDDGIERLEKENRELKTLVRSLQKRIKKLDRGHVKSRSRNTDESRLYEEPESTNPICPECSKGELITTILLNRKLVKCNTCEYREKAVKI